MKGISRRELLQGAGALAASAAWGALPVKEGVAADSNEAARELRPSFEWIRSMRLMIAEGYAPPFYPSLGL